MNRKLLSLLVTLVAMFGCLGSARAHDFIGEPVSAGKFYIRNNKTKTYIKNNSTSLSTSIDEACLFTLEADGNKYKLKNANGKYLSWAATESLDTNRSSGRSIVFQISDAGNTYRLYYDGLTGDPYLYLDGQLETSELTKGTGNGKNSEQAYWELISEDQVKALADTDTDASGKIHNANGNYNPKYAWTLSGNVNVLQGEDNKGKDGKVGIFEVSDWWASSFDCSMSQTITDLPNGCYRLTVDCQASAGSTLKIFAGDNETTTVSKNEGWETYDVIAKVTDGTLTIGARGTANSQFQWTNVDNFKLSYLGEDEVKLKIRENCYGTFVAPFDVTLPDGVVAYKVAEETATGVNLEQLTLTNKVLPAENPVIIKHENGALTEQTYYGPKATDTVTKNGLLGFYETGTTIKDGCYILQDQGEGQKFYIIDSTYENAPLTKSTKNRCCLPKGATPNSAKVLNLMFVETTAVGSTNTNAAIDGYYSVNGTRLSAPKSGINIIKMSDGSVKKVLVK